ncbi:MAG: alcohol dehydrogenase catalytic domain-containing protein [Candidatus Omnitrophica bacterium]|nr:alcohol dehydrogenase catalytic domain-containing protein [Candidatus Omnitrophota bacterium]
MKKLIILLIAAILVMPQQGYLSSVALAKEDALRPMAEHLSGVDSPDTSGKTSSSGFCWKIPEGAELLRTARVNHFIYDVYVYGGPTIITISPRADTGRLSIILNRSDLSRGVEDDLIVYQALRSQELYGMQRWFQDASTPAALAQEIIGNADQYAQKNSVKHTCQPADTPLDLKNANKHISGIIKRRIDHLYHIVSVEGYESPYASNYLRMVSVELSGNYAALFMNLQEDIDGPELAKVVSAMRRASTQFEDVRNKRIGYAKAIFGPTIIRGLDDEVVIRLADADREYGALFHGASKVVVDVMNATGDFNHGFHPGSDASRSFGTTPETSLQFAEECQQADSRYIGFMKQLVSRLFEGRQDESTVNHRSYTTSVICKIPTAAVLALLDRGEIALSSGEKTTEITIEGRIPKAAVEVVVVGDLKKVGRYAALENQRLHALLPTSEKTSSSGSYWTMLKGETIPQLMKGITSVPGVGPALGLFNTDYMKDPVRSYGVPPAAKFVIVKITSCGICSSDMPNLLTHTFAQKHNMSCRVLGHEGGGTVVAISGGVSRDFLGKTVAIESHVPWMPDHLDKPWYHSDIITSRYSIIGYDPNGGKIPVNGTWAEYVLLPLDNIYPLSSKLENILQGKSSILEPNGNAVYTVLAAKHRLESNGVPLRDARLLIVGLGWQGKMMMKIAKALGISVVGVDANKEAVDSCIASGIGNEHTALWSKDPNFKPFLYGSLRSHADVIIDACGAEGIIDNMSEYLKEDGLFILFGLSKLNQIVPGTDGITLENFVKQQHEQVVEINGKSMTLVGLCGRTQESWRWLVNEMETDFEFVGIILSALSHVGPLDRLVDMLYPYNGGDKSLIREATRSKVAMSGFSRALLQRPFNGDVLAGIFPHDQRFGIVSAEDLIVAGKMEVGTPLCRAIIPLTTHTVQRRVATKALASAA